MGMLQQIRAGFRDKAIGILMRTTSRCMGSIGFGHVNPPLIKESRFRVGIVGDVPICQWHTGYSMSTRLAPPISLSMGFTGGNIRPPLGGILRNSYLISIANQRSQ